MISNQSLAFVENGVAKGISKGHRGLLFRDGALVVVDGEGVEESPTMLALADDPEGAWASLVNGDAVVVVDSSGTDLERGVALVAAYAAARLCHPFVEPWR